MTVRLAGDGTIELAGTCPSEDAEALLRYLLAAPQATVDWRLCDGAHTAVVQVLAASKSELRGPPRGDFVRQVLAPAMTRARG